MSVQSTQSRRDLSFSSFPTKKKNCLFWRSQREIKNVEIFICSFDNKNFLKENTDFTNVNNSDISYAKMKYLKFYNMCDIFKNKSIMFKRSFLVKLTSFY